MLTHNACRACVSEAVRIYQQWLFLFAPKVDGQEDEVTTQSSKDLGAPTHSMCQSANVALKVMSRTF